MAHFKNMIRAVARITAAVASANHLRDAGI
jgi:hypothetical protein